MIQYTDSVRADHPAVTERINVHFQDMKQTKIISEVSHFFLNKDRITNKTISNVQPS